MTENLTAMNHREDVVLQAINAIGHRLTKLEEQQAAASVSERPSPATASQQQPATSLEPSAPPLQQLAKTDLPETQQAPKAKTPPAPQAV
eukprot:7982713-Alexandrium_andersonii.AAC.1